MSLYPDNVPRANRVNQLAGDISRFQNDIKEAVDDAKFEDQKTFNRLNIIAKDAGCKDLEEYQQKAFAQLTAAERETMESMKKKIAGFDEDMQLSHTVFRTMIALGVFMSGAKFKFFGVEIETAQSLLMGLQALVRGATQQAIRLITFGRISVDLVSRSQDLWAESANALKWMKRGGNVLTALGVVVDAGLLITEAIVGGQQRAKLRESINDLCARRVIVKQVLLQANVLLQSTQKVHELTSNRKNWNDWVRKGRETEEEAKKEIGNEFDQLSAQFKHEIDKITVIRTWDSLNELDEKTKAWKNEDPTLSEIEALVKKKEDELAAKEKDKANET
ncbi:hypothetical protein FRC09_018474 [Ceratobasidium sp. 395]|nr:hypothetical protein FRC09_018474 [Ceratobasidium sp. 395]